MDVNLRSRYGLMAAGTLTCIIGLAVAARLCETSKAQAQSDMGPVLPEPTKCGKASAPAPLPPLGTAIPTMIPPPAGEPPAAPDIVPAKAEVVAPPPGLPLATPPVPPPGADLPGVVPPLPGAAPLVPAKEAPPAAAPPGSEERPIIIPGGPVTPPMPPLTPVSPPVTGSPLPPINPPMTPVPPPVKDVPPPVVTPVEHKAEAVSVVTYRVRTAGMTAKSLARKTLGSVERWTEICKLNPAVTADGTLAVGATVSLPADASVMESDVTPLPSLRPRPTPRPKAVLPLTGTYPAKVDAKGNLVLPPSVAEQLGHAETLLLSPGSDRCLWLTNQAHLDRLGQKLDKSPARESDIQSFKRLYYAQTVKSPVREGRAAVNDRLAQFAGISGDVVLVGIDDRFEVWDAARWQKYTQAKKASVAAE